jgi:hypothetical protein
MNIRSFLHQVRKALGTEDLRKAKAKAQEILDKVDAQEAEVQAARKHADTRSIEVKQSCEVQSTRIAMTKALIETEQWRQAEGEVDTSTPPNGVLKPHSKKEAAPEKLPPASEHDLP